jgi:hypothetical protein
LVLAGLLAGVGGPSRLHFVGSDGQPFRLRPPAVDLVPNSLVALLPIPENAVPLGAPPRLDLFAPRLDPHTDLVSYQHGFTIGDAVANTLIFAGGAALLGTIIADWAKHH